MQLGTRFIFSDHDEEFEKLPIKPIILNHQPFETAADKEKVTAFIRTVYSEEDQYVDTGWSCSCGKLNQRHSKRTCDVCGGTVQNKALMEEYATVWAKCPEAAGSFFNLLFWFQMTEAFNLQKTDWNAFIYLCKPSYKKPQGNLEKKDKVVQYQQFIDELCASLGIERSLPQVIQNLDTIVDEICNFPPIAKKRPYLKKALLLNKSSWTARHLPIPPKSAFVLQKTNLGPYAEASLRQAMEAVCQIATIDENARPVTLINKTVSIMEALNCYHKPVLMAYGKKNKILRGTLFGSRFHFTARAVISSITETHDYRNIRVPYSQLVVSQEHRLIPKLVREHRMSFKQAAEYIRIHTEKRDPLLESILMEFINSKVGIWCLATRYPSIDPGSTQLLKVNGISDKTIEISILVTPAFNADFDGDEKTIMFLTTQEAVTLARPFMPHFNVFEANGVGTLAKTTKLPDITTAMISNAIIENGIIAPLPENYEEYEFG